MQYVQVLLFCIVLPIAKFLSFPWTKHAQPPKPLLIFDCILVVGIVRNNLKLQRHHCRTLFKGMQASATRAVRAFVASADATFRAAADVVEG